MNHERRSINSYSKEFHDIEMYNLKRNHYIRLNNFKARRDEFLFEEQINKHDKRLAIDKTKFVKAFSDYFNVVIVEPKDGQLPKQTDCYYYKDGYFVPGGCTLFKHVVYSMFEYIICIQTYREMEQKLLSGVTIQKKAGVLSTIQPCDYFEKPRA